MFCNVNGIHVFEMPLSSLHSVEVDTWCDLLEAGPMSRPVCHLTLDLIPAECGLLLSRVHNAELMEQLTLKASSLVISTIHAVCLSMTLLAYVL